MKSIAILNDIHDAEYVVQRRAQFNEVTLISAHAAAGITMHCLTRQVKRFTLFQCLIISQFYGLPAQIAENLRTLELQRRLDMASYKIFVSHSIHHKVLGFIENMAEFVSNVFHKHLTNLDVLLDSFVN